MPAAVGCAVSFGVYLVAAAGLSATGPTRAVGVAVLLVVAVILGCCTTLPGAALIGLLGWPFYSGFVTHSQGVLAATGRQDAVVVSLLVVAAVAASVVRGLLARAPIDEPALVDIPVQRRPAEELQHR